MHLKVNHTMFLFLWSLWQFFPLQLLFLLKSSKLKHSAKHDIHSLMEIRTYSVFATKDFRINGKTSCMHGHFSCPDQGVYSIHSLAQTVLKKIVRDRKYFYTGLDFVPASQEGLLGWNWINYRSRIIPVSVHCTTWRGEGGEN